MKQLPCIRKALENYYNNDQQFNRHDFEKYLPQN